jgi:gliding motility-associated-like protein
MYRLLTILLIVLPAWYAGAQTVCNTPGQNPTTAFPVCGTSVFNQASVNLCGGRTVPNPKCKTTPLSDINPYYYKFTCFKAGTLGLTITPNSNNSDYDWQIWDISNRNPNDVFTDEKMVICCNWSGYTGVTGTSPNAANLLECEGNVPQYSKMPDLIQGHEYLLLVSHFTNNQAGYRLEFKGGTAIITDTTQPQMKELTVGCGGNQFYLKLNKRMLCSSIATNGSDWEFFNNNTPITGTIGVGCSAGAFDTDSLLLITPGNLAAGNFAVRSKKGTDGNTMLDICGAPLPEGQTLVVNVLPAGPTPMERIAPVGCKPVEIDVLMKDNIRCNSIAANGSDFTLAGPTGALSISGATGVGCTNGSTKTIRIRLNAPVQVAGLYTLTVQQGGDANTLINDCAKETVAGDTLMFRGYDTVSATIVHRLAFGCRADTIYFSLPGYRAANSYRWVFDGQQVLNPGPAFYRTYSQNGRYTWGMYVTNGVCSDSALSGEWIRSKPGFNAVIEGTQFVCPGDTAIFTDKSTGTISSWLWTFGNGQTSTLQNPPPQMYPPNSGAQGVDKYFVRLSVSSPDGCTDDTTYLVQVPGNCYIAVPSGFTPNGDGLNDYLYPLNAWKATNLHFAVYNRYGQKIWETTDWTRRWDGRINGQPQPTGTYVWRLQYKLDGRTSSQQGTVVLIR